MHHYKNVISRIVMQNFKLDFLFTAEHLLPGPTLQHLWITQQVNVK